MKTTNTIKNLKVGNFYHTNQFVIEYNNEIYFQSYESIIAKITEYGNLYLTDKWDYSQTTLKHLYLFIQDYLLYIKDKVCYHELYYAMYVAKNKKQAIKKLLLNGFVGVFDND